MQEALVRFLGWEDPLENGQATDPVFLDFCGGSDSKESACNAGDMVWDPLFGKIPWRRAWQPIPVFSPGESPWTEEPRGLQFMGSQRVGHD